MPNENPEPVLQIRELSVTYKGDGYLIKAVNDVSLELKKGEILGIAGESGSGKTSICKSLLGVCFGHISGEIMYNGKNLLENKTADWKRLRWNKIAYCFPSSREILNPSYSVLEQMIEPMLESGLWKRKEAIERAHDLLLQCRLPVTKHDSYPVHLSGGELQRVMIALTLANDPEIMIFDEPISGIDIKTQAEIVDLLKEVLSEKTSIIVSHDLMLLRELANRIGILYRGALMELAAAQSFFRDQLHPYSRALYNSFTSLETSREMSGIRDSRNTLPFLSENSCVFADRCTQAVKICFQETPQSVLLNDRLISCHRKGFVNLLQTNNLEKAYRIKGSIWGPEIQVLKNININVEAGEVVALVGESGAGKTTLGKIICKLIRQDRGEIYYDETVCKNDVQYIFQDPEESVSPRYTVLEAIREPLDIKGELDIATRNEMAREMLATVGLCAGNNLCDRHCLGLSSGEMQRLCVGRALITSPRILIADEPVSKLDPSEQIRILKLLLELQTSYGVGMIFITHNLYLARKISRRIYVMRQGEIVEEGFTETVLTEPQTSYTANLANLTFNNKTVR
jgi:peptide/nickel transport system ATP-binding protein